MLISKTVEIRIANSNRKYYEMKGYRNIKNGDIINVNIEDLPKGSHAIIQCKCDYCNSDIQMSYKTYILETESRISSTLACKKCKRYKSKKSNIIKYGAPSPMCIKEIQDKAKQTTMEHYGVEHPNQSLEIQHKIEQSTLEKYGVNHISQLQAVKDKKKQTNIEYYGVSCPFQSEDIKQKIKNTMIEKYGVDNPSQSDIVKQKKKETLLNHYGVEYTLQSPIIREKLSKTMYENQNVCTSYQQKYIAKLYSMSLNYPVGGYNVDMCDVDNKIICEYDGGGHKLSIIHGNCTEEEFHQKEIIRDNIIKRKGYKIFRIVSAKDKLPSSEKLLLMLEEAKTYFNRYPNHSWIEFDIDNNCTRNAEHKEGIPFDFGETKLLYKDMIVSEL